MSAIHFNIGGKPGILNIAGEYKPGDMPPEGYLDWMEWANVQQKAGVKQVKCCCCGLWKTPQELSGKTKEWSEYRTKRDAMAKTNPIKKVGAICLKCAAAMDKRAALRGVAV